MKRKATKLAVIIISILLAELVHEYIQNLFRGWVEDSSFGLYASVAISMAAAVIVFYPAFKLIQSYLKYASKRYVEGSKKISRQTITGLVIGFVVALFLLFIGFSEVWYHRNPLLDWFH